MAVKLPGKHIANLLLPINLDTSGVTVFARVCVKNIDTKVRQGENSRGSGVYVL